MKKLLIILLFPSLSLASEVVRTCVNIEFNRSDTGEVISCSEARDYPEDKALQKDVKVYCND